MKNKKVMLYCKVCDKYYKIESSEKIIMEEKGKKIGEIKVLGKADIEKDLPKTKIICPNCGNDEAYWWMQQTRAIDEPPTLFYRCVKCKYTWRSYG